MKKPACEKWKEEFPHTSENATALLILTRLATEWCKTTIAIRSQTYNNDIGNMTKQKPRFTNMGDESIEFPHQVQALLPIFQMSSIINTVKLFPMLYNSQKLEF